MFLKTTFKYNNSFKFYEFLKYLQSYRTFCIIIYTNNLTNLKSKFYEFMSYN